MDNNNSNNEKIMLKIVLEQINENINSKFDLLREEIKNIENNLLSSIKEKYINKEECKKNIETINKSESIQLQKEEFSYKKWILAASTISSLITAFLTYLSQKL